MTGRDRKSPGPGPVSSPNASLGDEESNTDPGLLEQETVVTSRPDAADLTRAQATSQAAEIGEQIGGYRLDGLLGEGGGGSVYLATQLATGREVAVKVLATRLAGDAEYVSRFFHEARVVGEIKHPNIVEILEFIVTEAPKRVAYVMDLVEGVPLSQLLALRRLSAHEALSITMQLAHALEAVHKLEVVHRDLKPENILVEGYDGGRALSVKILDFGVAKFGSDVEHHTRTGAMLGTPRYMAPEQLFDEPITPKADVYALGEIFYEALTGRRVFEGDNRAVMKAKSSDSSVLGLEISDDVPGADQIRSLLLASLAQDPANRPTVKDFWGRLVGIMSTLPSDERSQMPVPEAPRSSWIPTRSKEGGLPLIHGTKDTPLAPQPIVERPLDTPSRTAARVQRRPMSPRAKRVLAALLLFGPAGAGLAYAAASPETKSRAAALLGRVSIELVSNPRGAAFSVDGIDVCQAGRVACGVVVSRGDHRVTARLRHHETRTTTVHVSDPATVPIELTGAYGELDITSAPAGVSLALDGEPTARSPRSLAVTPGEHVLSVSGRCVEAVERRVRVERGTRTSIDLSTKEKKSVLKLNPSGPRRTPVHAEVWLDGQLVGMTPMRLEVSVCARTLELRHPTLGTFKRNLTLSPDTTISMDPVLGDEVLVPHGEFVMGCDPSDGFPCEVSSQPAHPVMLESYLIDRTEVSVGEYRTCVDAGACSATGTDGYEWKGQPFTKSVTCNFGKPKKSAHPINCVDHAQAEAYCRFRRRRLPSEAEWEKAARGTDRRPFPWGSDKPTCELVALRFQGTECVGTTQPVSTKPSGASPFGALHMAGNVAEWVSDFYDERYYTRSPPTSPTGPQSGTMRTTRGGHFSVTDVSGLPLTERRGARPEDRFDTLGFRCARSATVSEDR